MNYVKLLSICALSAFVVSCGTTEVEGGDGTTEVILSLDTDGTHHTKSVSEEILPSIEDFTVEIFKKESGARLYRDTYANAKDQKSASMKALTDFPHSTAIHSQPVSMRRTTRHSCHFPSMPASAV